MKLPSMLSAYLLGKQNAFTDLCGYNTKIVEAVNDLTFDILRGQLDNMESNFIFSPISVLLVISIFNYGLGDLNVKARNDLLGNLKLNSYRHKLHHQTGSLLKNLTKIINQPPDIELDMLTMLQFAKYLRLSNQMEEELSLNYNALVNEYDFFQKEERMKALNETYRLIRQHTKNQLNLFGLQHLPRESSRLNLYSTVHLSTTWLDSFNSMHTFSDRFFSQNGRITKVLYMSRNTYVNTSTLLNRDLQLIELPLENKQLGFIIIIPSQRYALHEMLSNAKNDELNLAIKNFSQKYINIRIPRFTIEQQTTIQELLKPFKIDLSLDCKHSSLQRFSKVNRTCLDFNLLYTRLKIDEQGINTINQEGAFYGQQKIDSSVPKLFVRSPFAFIIRDITTGVFLLAGLFNQF